MSWKEYKVILIWVFAIYVVLVTLAGLFASEIVVPFSIGYWFGHAFFVGLIYFLRSREEKRVDKSS